MASSPGRATSNEPFATGAPITCACERHPPVCAELQDAPRADVGRAPPLARLVRCPSQGVGAAVRQRADGTVGGVVHHVFAVELRYTQRLRDQRVSEWDEFRESSLEEIFALGDNARAQLVEFFTSAGESDLDKILTFKTLTAGTVTASKHKIASNMFLHDIRHWAQIATVLRQNGFADQWPHDMLLSDVSM